MPFIWSYPATFFASVLFLLSSAAVLVFSLPTVFAIFVFVGWAVRQSSISTTWWNFVFISLFGSLGGGLVVKAYSIQAPWCTMASSPYVYAMALSIAFWVGFIVHLIRDFIVCHHRRPHRLWHFHLPSWRKLGSLDDRDPL